MEEQNLEVPIVLARGYNLKKSHKNDISIFNEYNFQQLHKSSNVVKSIISIVLSSIYVIKERGKYSYKHIYDIIDRKIMYRVYLL